MPPHGAQPTNQQPTTYSDQQQQRTTTTDHRCPARSNEPVSARRPRPRRQPHAPCHPRRPQTVRCGSSCARTTVASAVASSARTRTATWSVVVVYCLWHGRRPTPWRTWVLCQGTARRGCRVRSRRHCWLRWSSARTVMWMRSEQPRFIVIHLCQVSCHWCLAATSPPP
jgi:hypothetical protein